MSTRQPQGKVNGRAVASVPSFGTLMELRPPVFENDYVGVFRERGREHRPFPRHDPLSEKALHRIESIGCVSGSHAFEE